MLLRVPTDGTPHMLVGSSKAMNISTAPMGHCDSPTEMRHHALIGERWTKGCGMLSELKMLSETAKESTTKMQFMQ